MFYNWQQINYYQKYVVEFVDGQFKISNLIYSANELFTPFQIDLITH